MWGQGCKILRPVIPRKHRPRSRTLQVATVQFESQPGDKESNFATLETFVRKAAHQGARLVVFPECCITGYWFLRHLTRKQLGVLAEPIPDGPSTRRLQALAREQEARAAALAAQEAERVQKEAALAAHEAERVQKEAALAGLAALRALLRDRDPVG